MPVQQLQRQQRGMPFVHVIGLDVEAKRPQQAVAADAQHDLLAQAVGIVAAIEIAADVPVLRRVLVQECVQQEHGNLIAQSSPVPVKPGPDPDIASLHGDRDLGAKRRRPALRLPRVRLFDLTALGVDALPEIPCPADQGDEDDRQFQIGAGPHGIAGEDAKPAGIGVDFRAQRYFH